MERLTRKDKTATESCETEVGKKITQNESDGKTVPCASTANSHCLSRKANGCCGEHGSSNRNSRESISGSSGSGKNNRKHCTSSCARKDSKRKPDGEYVSGATELACVLLFGHTMTELLDTEESPGSKR